MDSPASDRHEDIGRIIGARVRARREELGLTRNYVATKASISVQKLVALEDNRPGQRLVTRTLIRVAAVLAIGPAEFLTGLEQIFELDKMNFPPPPKRVAQDFYRRIMRHMERYEDDAAIRRIERMVRCNPYGATVLKALHEEGELHSRPSRNCL